MRFREPTVCKALVEQVLRKCSTGTGSRSTGTGTGVTTHAPLPVRGTQPWTTLGLERYRHDRVGPFLIDGWFGFGRTSDHWRHRKSEQSIIVDVDLSS